MKLRGEILAILISASMLGCSQSKSTPQEKESLRQTIKIEDKYLKSILDDFFTQYKSSPNKAIEIIFQTNKDYINKEQVSQLTSRLDSTTRALGAYTGQKLIFEKNVGEDFRLYSYMVKHQRQPIRFNFYFYKADSKWELYRFQYNTQLDEELEQASKLYMFE